jgi:hypothetical protein
MNRLPELSSTDFDALAQLQRAVEGQGTVVLDPADPQHRPAIDATLKASGRDSARYPALHTSLAQSVGPDGGASTTRLVDAGVDPGGRATAWVWHQAQGAPLHSGSSLFAIDQERQALLAYGENTSLTGFLATSTDTATAQPPTGSYGLLDVAHAAHPDGTTRYTAFAAPAPTPSADGGDVTVTVTQPLSKLLGTNQVVIALGRDSAHGNPDADYTFVEPENVEAAPYLIVPLVCQAAVSYAIAGTPGQPPSPIASITPCVYFVKTDGSVVTIQLDPTSTPPARLAKGVYINSSDQNLLEVTYAADGNSYQDTSALVFGTESLVNEQISYFFFQCQIPVVNAPVQWVTFTVCSMNTPHAPTPNCRTIGPIQFWWHCLAAGTQVRMQDGSDAPIETLDNTCRVRTGHGGDLAVEATSRGPHLSTGAGGPAGVYRLQTESGRELVATGSHPIVTPVGMVALADLRVGQNVLSEDGLDVVASKEAVAHEGDFHNLKLGDESDRAAAGGAIVGTFLANGIAVGDHLAMKVHTEQRRRDLDFILPRLEPGVRLDYTSAVHDVRY